MVSKDKWKEKLYNGGSAYVPPIPTIPLLELAGNHRVMIENHCGVHAYSDTQICVRIPKGWYTVTGQNLSLAYMSRCQLVIAGSIFSVQVERGTQP